MFSLPPPGAFVFIAILAVVAVPLMMSTPNLFERLRRWRPRVGVLLVPMVAILFIGCSGQGHAQASDLSVTQMARLFIEHAPTPLPPRYEGCPASLRFEETLSGKRAEADLSAVIHFKGSACKKIPPKPELMKKPAPTAAADNPPDPVSRAESAADLVDGGQAVEDDEDDEAVSPNEPEPD